MPSQLWLIFLLWLLWTATAVQCGFAVNGYLNEKRHGMRISLFRLSAIVGIFVVATSLVIFVTLLPQDYLTAAAQNPENPGPQSGITAPAPSRILQEVADA